MRSTFAFARVLDLSGAAAAGADSSLVDDGILKTFAKMERRGYGWIIWRACKYNAY